MIPGFKCNNFFILAQLKALLEWYELYRDELLADWQLAERHQPLIRIPPLE